ncbi:MAG TPA: hypothetical protein VE084_14395 [Burkholderiaceae bacterium]|nr:hypothetical protein [Burkholderiaceae bacterium]
MLRYLRFRQPDITEAEAMRLAKDGPRYKALGNSWAVPCALWIGKRIASVINLKGPNSPCAAEPVA